MKRLKQGFCIHQPKQPLGIGKPKQALGKFKTPFHKFKQHFKKSRLRKMCQYLPLRQDLYARREIEFRRSQNSRYSSPVNNFSLIQESNSL